MTEKKTWTVLKCPAMSPELSPSEHLWTELKCAENWSALFKKSRLNYQSRSEEILL